MRNNLTIAVIGLGLIGGSILKSLKNKGFNLIGISKSEETLKKAKALDIANECSTDISKIAPANAVFICAPINTVTSLIEETGKFASPDCIITDVASIKSFIIDYVNNSDFPVNFTGGHPMAGTENKGIEAASDDLFDGTKWVLTPSKWSKPEDIKKLGNLINILGAKTIITDPYKHDKAVALISHLPLLISQAIFGMVSDYPDKDVGELALKLAASGFRDTTRLAATNPELAKDILLKNKTFIRETIIDLKDYLAQLDKNLDLKEKDFIELVENYAIKRKKMYSSEGKNIYGKI